MAADEKWYFTKEQLTNTPSRKCGIDADKELSYRQQAANFIQDMGQKLNVTQLCINTAIVYMHRFYVFHSLSQFHRNAIASAALFLAAKVEEQPRKLEHVIKVSHLCLHREPNSVDIKSEAQDLVFNENVLLQTLGFDVAIDHPHTHVVRCCQLVKASKDLAQTSYFMASNSLHLTTMCLQYKPTVVACFCIHLACKWSNWEIPQSNEGKYWFWYVDRTVTAELLQQLTAEFLHIFDKCPSRLKKKIMSISEKQSPSMHHQSLPNSLFDAEPRRINSPANDGGPTFQSLRPFPVDEDRRRPSTSTQGRLPVDYREHREKKERERLERERIAGASGTAPPPSSSSSSLSAVAVATVATATATTTVSTQPPTSDLKLHPHHHKLSSTSISSTTVTTAPTGTLVTTAISKHPPILNQKTNVHHNHHHRPDLKLQQQPLQRHSSNSQARDPSRDLSRQRIPRDYTSGQAPTAVPPYSHVHPTIHQINSSLNDGPLTSDMTAPTGTDPIQIHQNPLDKLTNNNHNAHRPIQHDKRVYDPRHKIIEHRKDDPKNYAKYPGGDQVRADRQRKPDSLEQRSEEVRKLIEKPLPLPKPRAEVQKEEYISSMLKQSHHPKYGQDKIPTAHNSSRNLMPQDFSKASTSKPLMSSQHSHGVAPILKDIKNGNTNVVTTLHSNNNNVDDPKSEKRPRPEEPVATQVPLIKHKSLFSPEKVSNNREQHSQRSSKSTRQKTPPVSAKIVKQERVPEIPSQVPQGADLISPFASPPPLSQSLLITNFPASSHKRTKSTNIGDTEQLAKVKTEEQSGFEAMKMLGRVPELIQPIRDTPGSINGRTSLVVNDLKPPELIKPFEPEVDTRHAFTNGLDGINIKNESRDPIQRKEESNMSTIDRLENSSQIKNEYLSPLKSAQSISALLQEPLAPMPSLLQPNISESLHSTQSIDSGFYSSSQTQSQEHINQVQSSVSMSQVQESALITDEQFALSTVDISALSTPVQIVPEVPIVAVTNNPPSEVKKTEHHKSEKKKKKEKHKHKDKDKSKEKHKHKHKDKDKEKHRDKERDKDKDKDRNKDKDKEKDKDKDNKNEETSAAPIKITIPKDKLNLSSDSNIIHDKKSPQSTGLKIKIPKERLKGTDSSIVPPIVRDIQAPLKIKIRTSGAISDYPESRKRERDFSENLTQPPNKKSQLTVGNQMFVGQQTQQQQQQQQQHQQHQHQQSQHQHQQSQPHQRSSERQNGRHYSSGSNNKEKHSSREHKSSSKLSQSQQFHAT